MVVTSFIFATVLKIYPTTRLTAIQSFSMFPSSSRNAKNSSREISSLSRIWCKQLFAHSGNRFSKRMASCLRMSSQLCSGRSQGSAILRWASQRLMRTASGVGNAPLVLVALRSCRLSVVGCRLNGVGGVESGCGSRRCRRTSLRNLPSYSPRNGLPACTCRPSARRVPAAPSRLSSSCLLWSCPFLSSILSSTRHLHHLSHRFSLGSSTRIMSVFMLGDKLFSAVVGTIHDVAGFTDEIDK